MWEYRGSLVELQAGTEYEVKLSLEEGAIEQVGKIRTWSEEVPIADTIYVSSRNRPLVIRRSGSPDGYLLYMPAPGDPGLIDVQGAYELCLKIKTNYIIVRGFTLRGATNHALRINRNHHIIVEQCDIADWGGKVEGPARIGQNFDSGIFSEGDQYFPRHITIQDNHIHHPTYGASFAGQAGSPRKESVGPQAITIMEGGGDLVIRRNKIYSEAGRYFRDGMGEWRNHTYFGFPYRNADIAHNYISHCWDDAIEAEGANENVRIWGNYTSHVFHHLATANSTFGPLYVWRNVAGHTEKRPGETGGNWAKLYAPGQLDESETPARGLIYLFHNTLLQEQAGTPISGPDRAFSGYKVISRNNLFWTSGKPDNLPEIEVRHASSSLDYDGYLGELRGPGGEEVHGFMIDSLRFDSLNVPPDVTRPVGGTYWLEDGSPGHDQGVVLPGFNDGFEGRAPDIGAFERPIFPPDSLSPSLSPLP
ncbi:MAG: right-handed parallel beta-helix repeat-containing protein [Bacteroidota bacterium]